MPRTPAIRLTGVSISYVMTGGRRYDAVAPVDVAVEDGAFVSIVGPTGCGKSTLLNVAAGLAAPTTGTVDIYGAPLSGLNGQSGYLFQQDALMPWKSAEDNVALGLEIKGIARAEALSQARSMLGKVGLKAFGDRYPHELSGGQKKRVALAQVLVRHPKILLMDEPFGPLDAQTRLVMGELLSTLWQADRKAVMFVTHDLDEAIGLSDRVLIMSAGPQSRIIGDFAVDIERPRDLGEIRHDPRFHRLHRDIWSVLRDEVRKTYGLADA